MSPCELSVRREGRVIAAVMARGRFARKIIRWTSRVGKGRRGHASLANLSEALESVSRLSEMGIEVPELPEAAGSAVLPEMPKFGFPVPALVRDADLVRGVHGQNVARGQLPAGGASIIRPRWDRRTAAGPRPRLVSSPAMCSPT